MNETTVAVLSLAAATGDRPGDASLVEIPLPFATQDAAMLLFALRMAIGDALDSHADPRGVFCLPAGTAPRRRDYAGIIAAHGPQGRWLAWPQEPPEPPPEPREGPDAALMAQMAARLGQAAALDLAIPLEVALINEMARPDQPGTAATAEAAIAAAMDADFAERLAAALRLRFATELAHGTAPPPILLE